MCVIAFAAAMFLGGILIGLLVFESGEAPGVASPVPGLPGLRGIPDSNRALSMMPSLVRNITCRVTGGCTQPLVAAPLPGQNKLPGNGVLAPGGLGKAIAPGHSLLDPDNTAKDVVEGTAPSTDAAAEPAAAAAAGDASSKVPAQQ